MRAHPVDLSDRTCKKCLKVFTRPSDYRRHAARKTPCDPIIDKGDLDPDLINDPDLAKKQCKFCNRIFGSYQSMRRHIRSRCKIAPNSKNGTKGMEKLYEHTLKKQLDAQRQEIEVQRKEMAAQREELEEIKRVMLSGGGAGHQAGGGGDVVLGDKVVNNTTNHTTNTTIVFNVAGAESMDMITREWVQEIAEGNASALDIMVGAFAKVCCDPERLENMSYYVPNKKDVDSVMVRRCEGWLLEPRMGAFRTTVRRLAARILDHQPTKVEVSEITNPKVEELKPWELANGVPPMEMALGFWRCLKAHPHGLLSKVVVSAARGRKRGEGAAPATAAEANPAAQAVPGALMGDDEWEEAFE